MIFNPKPVVIGHRGFGRGVVDGHEENTLASYQAALEAGLTWVEADAARTADGLLVTTHNPATADGEFLVDLSAAEVGEHGVPLLSDIVQALPDGIGVNVDVKTTLEDALVPPEKTTFGLLVPLLLAERERRPLFVSSFDAAALLHIREQTGLPVGLIGWVRYPLRMAISTAVHLGFQAVCLHVESFGPNAIEPGPVHRPADRSVAVAHEAGLEVVAWCPEVEQVEELVQAGVDAVVVNDVRETLAVLAASAPPPQAPEVP